MDKSTGNRKFPRLCDEYPLEARIKDYAKFINSHSENFSVIMRSFEDICADIADNLDVEGVRISPEKFVKRIVLSEYFYDMPTFDDWAISSIHTRIFGSELLEIFKTQIEENTTFKGSHYSTFFDIKYRKVY
jgi:hypothetical protein